MRNEASSGVTLQRRLSRFRGVLRPYSRFHWERLAEAGAGSERQDGRWRFHTFPRLRAHLRYTVRVRVLLIADIHANLVALEAVLRDAEAGGALDAVWNMGDCVGYGPQPGECVARVQELRALSVAGNHDRAATGAMGTDEFNPGAAAAVRWTGERLSLEDKSFLDSMPEVMDADGVTCVHGTLRGPVWEYLYSYEAGRAHLARQATHVSFIGHTHIPTLVLEDEVDETSPGGCELRRLNAGQRVWLTRERKQAINPGSVGQPRDGDPRAAYAIFDTDEETVTLHRVTYDIPAVQKLMQPAELPKWLIERLALGR